MPPTTRRRVASAAVSPSRLALIPDDPHPGPSSIHLATREPSRPRVKRKITKHYRQHVGFDNLSEDILLLILQEGLSVRDLLALRQLNKRIYAFTKLRFPWFHLIRAMAPLIPLTIQDPPPLELSARRLEDAAIRAYRLQHSLSGPEPLPISNSFTRVKSTALTSMKLVGGKWLITSHKDDRSSSETEWRHYLRCWDVSGSEPINTTGATTITLGGGNSSVTILDAQYIQGGESILVALDTALYLPNAYLINRAISFSILKLPKTDVLAHFMQPGLLCRLEFSIHRDDDMHHRSKRPPISSLDGTLFAYSRDAILVYVMNWRTGHVVTLVPPPESTEPNTPAHVVQIKLIGLYLLVITCRAFLIYELPSLLVTPGDQQQTHPTIFIAEPLASFLIPSNAFWAAAISKEVTNKPCRSSPYFDPTADTKQDTVEETLLNILLFGRNSTQNGRTMRHYVVRLYDIFADDADKEPTVPIAVQFAPQLISYHRSAVQHLYYVPPITPALGPSMFQVVLGTSGRRAVWFCDRRAAVDPTDRLVGYCAPLSQKEYVGPLSDEPEDEPDQQDNSEECLEKNLNKGLVRELFSNAFAKTTRMNIRGDLQDASCIAFDEVVGLLCVGTNKGGIHMLRYAPAPPEDELPQGPSVPPKSEPML